MAKSTDDKADNLKFYLDYLDKEMTIMGILSTFCILTLGFVSGKLLFPDKKPDYDFWHSSTLLCFFALSGFLLAAMAFYRQRSHLAWYYGQLSLYKARGDETELIEMLEYSNQWYNWTWYQAGFGFLTISFFELGTVCLTSVNSYVYNHQILIGILLIVIIGLYFAFVIVAYTKFSDSEKPVLSMLKNILQSDSKRAKKNNP
jgi:hypothetical protein